MPKKHKKKRHNPHHQNASLTAVRYPYGVTKEIYREILVAHYKEKYPEFTEKQLWIQTYFLVGALCGAFEAFRDYTDRLCLGQSLRRFVRNLQQNKPHEKATLSNLGWCSSFQKYLTRIYQPESKKRPSAKGVIAMYKSSFEGLFYPEDKQMPRYLEFVKEMAPAVTLAMVEANERFIKNMQNKEYSSPLASCKSIDTATQSAVQSTISETKCEDRPRKRVRFFVEAPSSSESDDSETTQPNKKIVSSPEVEKALTAEQGENNHGFFNKKMEKLEGDKTSILTLKGQEGVSAVVLTPTGFLITIEKDQDQASICNSLEQLNWLGRDEEDLPIKDFMTAKPVDKTKIFLQPLSIDVATALRECKYISKENSKELRFKVAGLINRLDEDSLSKLESPNYQTP